MLHCFDPIRTLSFWAILVRLSLAVVCGGVIGAERETKRRPAGFRTHILICLGAAITTLTSQYLLLSLHLFTDVARLGAQDRKSTRLNSSHRSQSRMPSSA